VLPLDVAESCQLTQDALPLALGKFKYLLNVVSQDGIARSQDDQPFHEVLQFSDGSGQPRQVRRLFFEKGCEGIHQHIRIAATEVF
jgi:hypothetical protein